MTNKIYSIEILEGAIEKMEHQIHVLECVIQGMKMQIFQENMKKIRGKK